MSRGNQHRFGPGVDESDVPVGSRVFARVARSWAAVVVGTVVFVGGIFFTDGDMFASTGGGVGAVREAAVARPHGPARRSSPPPQPPVAVVVDDRSA